jgi:ligand-binding SRPBCC domain-containing protein
VERVCHFRITSTLAVEPARLWEHATSIAGVNQELWPIRMSAPRSRLDESVPLDQKLFVSRVTLFGVIPLDLHELGLAAFEPGKSFHERSRTLLERRWEHRRTLTPRDNGSTELEDDVRFEPRLFAGVVKTVVARVFLRRHRALRRKFGSGDAAPVVEWI